MNILFVLENYLPHIGGLETIFQNLMEGLVKEGHSVTLVTHQMKGTKKFEVIGGVKIHRVWSLQSRYIFTFFSIPKTIALSLNADIIHTTTYNATFPAKIASLIRRIPIVITVHEVLGKNWPRFGGMGYLKGKIHQLFEYLILKLDYTRYVCVSNSTMNDLLKININEVKCRVIYNGLDYDFWDPQRYTKDKLHIRESFKLKDNFVYLFYGRPGISKGLEFLIRAVPLIKQKIPNSKLLAIVSRDKAYEKQYDKMIKLIKILGIQDDVILHNPVPREDLPYFIKSADCVIVPSLTEGFGFNVAESCALGIPVVASNTHSIPEVISGKFVLVKPGSPKSITEGILAVHKKMLNRTKIKRFLKGVAVHNYMKIYSQIYMKRSIKNMNITVPNSTH